MKTEAQILYETKGGRFWVARQGSGFAVFESGATHSVRVASIGDGPGPRLGIERALAEADRRNSQPVRR